MYKLYYSPGSCSMAVHVALNECNQPVTLEKIDISKGQGHSSEYLKINPRGQVPALDDDGLIVREGAAILIHILEKNHSPLLPKTGNDRTLALQWLMFCNATLHPAYARVFFLMKNPSDDATKDTRMDVAIKMINKLWVEVEESLASSPYLAGSHITMADILLTVIANWSPRMPQQIVLGPHTKKLLQTVIARPAYKKALEVEQVEYKAAA